MYNNWRNFGKSHGPELKGLLPLIGEDKAKQRLAGKVA